MSEDLTSPEQLTLSEIALLIQASRTRAFQAVNQELIELYWEVGRLISGKARTPSGVPPWLLGSRICSNARSRD